MGLGHTLAACAAAVVCTVPAVSRADVKKDPPAWCAPELETLADDVCYFDAQAASGPRTAVIFLHGLIKPDSTWQWAQQRGIVRVAKRAGFSVLAPRGRRGVGPGGMSAVAWPLSAASQQSVEQTLIDEWMRAKKTIEARTKPFDEVFVVGFSNGAYFASSLAMRERLTVDGYALFAGGSTTGLLRQAGESATKRPPIFVAVETSDPTSSTDSQNFAALLNTLHWPHKVNATAVGHGVDDHQLERGIDYLHEAVRQTRSQARH